MVIALGFIDMHSHSDFLLFEDGQAQSKIRQGVTTEVLGEGTSVEPYQGKLAPRGVSVAGKELRWTTLGAYLDAIERSGIAVKVASYVGLDNNWPGIMSCSFDRLTAQEMDRMQALVDEAMQDAAFGLSTMLMMPPGSLATPDDPVPDDPVPDEPMPLLEVVPLLKADPDPCTPSTRTRSRPSFPTIRFRPRSQFRLTIR